MSKWRHEISIFKSTVLGLSFMMKPLSTCLLLRLALVGVHAQKPRRESGLIGYGIAAFDPFCAFGCRDSISGATLNCSEVTTEEMDGMPGMTETMVMTEPECYATDDVFLQTLALCIQSHCQDIQVSKLERYWERNVAGTNEDQPDPKYTYQQALAKINSTSIATYDGTGSLNETSAVSEVLWFANYNTDEIFIRQESQQEKFGLVILLSGVVIPFAFSILRLLPFPGIWSAKFHARIIDPPLFGSRHDRPILFGLATVPKRGQALFIFYFIVLNVVLSCVNYQVANPNTWYPDDESHWICMLVANRLGLLSFANLPLVFLYAGRINILIWITDWSHSTFLLLHRWIAGIATLQAILHSAVYLYVYVKAGTHSAESKLPYWYWGIIATLGMFILFPSSILPIRKKFYELFLAWHVIISILIVVGCYYHIIFEFSHQWGYETWIYVVMAVWAFDRISRVFRLLRNGVQTAKITVIDDDYIRITIPHVTASGHAYLYFPTLTWRVWENHPFSIAVSHLSAPNATNLVRRQPQSSSNDIEKHPNSDSYAIDESISDDIHAGNNRSTRQERSHAGIVFYIRTQTGLTSHLRRLTTLPVLVEAGYSSHSPLSKPLYHSPTLIALAGGVGISAVLPHLHTHPGRAKLYWGCRTQALVDDVMATSKLSVVEREVCVGGRLAIREILEMELAGGNRCEICVLVSGPEEMIDEVRNVVDSIRKEGRTNVRLEVESFNW